MSGNMLLVEGERRTKEEVEEDDYYHCEGACGRFHREIPLPPAAQKGKITSTHKDGVLEIHVPKAEEAKPKEVEIKVE